MHDRLIGHLLFAPCLCIVCCTGRPLNFHINSAHAHFDGHTCYASHIQSVLSNYLREGERAGFFFLPAPTNIDYHNYFSGYYSGYYSTNTSHTTTEECAILNLYV